MEHNSFRQLNKETKVYLYNACNDICTNTVNSIHEQSFQLNYKTGHLYKPESRETHYIDTA